MDSSLSPTDRLRVLYVEDHVVNTILMRALFERRPQFDLIEAATGAVALRMAREHQPDLLLLDLHLPDCHGADLLQRLRRMPALRDIPAVAVTADTHFDAQAAGFDELWGKPLDLYRVLQRLDALAGGWRRETAAGLQQRRAVPLAGPVTPGPTDGSVNVSRAWT